MLSPYHPNKPIRDVNLLVGRRQHTEVLTSYLLRPLSVNIVGANRKGKTSFAINIEGLANKYGFSARLNNSRLAYFDAQRSTIHDATELLVDIYHILEPSFVYQKDQMDSSDLLDILAHKIQNLNYNLVIIIDETEVLLSNGDAFPLKFWYMIRYLISNHENIAFIFITQKPLAYYWDTFDHLKLDSGSPAYNVFAVLHIDNLRKNEVDELFQLSDIPFKSKEKEWIYKFSATDPAKLQVACYTMYELKKKNPNPTRSDFRRYISYYNKSFNPISKRPSRFIMFLVYAVIILLFAPNIGLVARVTGNSLDEFVNMITGSAILIVVTLAMFGKIPISKIRDYIERIIGS